MLCISCIRANLYYFRSAYTRNFSPNYFYFGGDKEISLKLAAIKSFKSQGDIYANLLQKLTGSLHYLNLHYKEIGAIQQSAGSNSLYSEEFFLAKKVTSCFQAELCL